ncbi:uncharacterized protein BX663DRAFT_555473 [Cokeromyces recurvatus]|uniref:uncharacterized protein n=1 Tax=Cokeromyces recurvatus TaxID=90255 RepID=UPI00221E4B90|nr:uncharacterized protein BX663DRAFT_555473 [Cokeromyces recurvatus]KAI7898935.1 hypothetical protein BX663DRAFT_555473 [Cokeromyces recurvatus]
MKPIPYDKKMDILEKLNTKESYRDVSKTIDRSTRTNGRTSKENQTEMNVKEGKKQSEGSNNNNNGAHKQQNRNVNNNNSNNRKWANAAAGRNHAPAVQNEPTMHDSSSNNLMHDRMLFLLGNLTGTVVEVTVKDGSKFRGIFHGASTEGELGIALKLAQKIFDPSAPIDKDKTNPNPVKNTLLIFSKDLVEINVEQLDLTTSETPDRNTFKTDSDISGKLDIKERELHKWTPDDALELLEDDLESSKDTGAWDQFAANEKLFGLKTDFDEEIYTTPLNRLAPGFKDREKRAIQVANEIQRSTTTNIHVLEERGVSIDGMDEEDLYGAVVRDSNPNKYLPPALRKQNQDHNKKESVKIASLNKLITSDLPKSTGSTLSPIANLPRRGETTEKTNEPPKRIEAEVATTFKQFAMMEKDKLHAKKQALQKREKDGRLAELKAFHQSFKLNVPIPPDLVPLLSKGKKNNNTIVSPSPTAIKKDSTSHDKKTPNETTSPTPSKILPVQDNKPTTTTTAATTTTTTTPPPPPTATTTATTTAKTTTTTTNTTAASASPSSKNTTTSPKSTFKFNVKASAFKPNPSAAVFVPSHAHNTDTADTHPSNRSIKRGQKEHITMSVAFKPPPFNKQSAQQVGPTWPFGNKSYRVQFSSFAYEEDMYIAYPYGYPAYRYPPYVPSPQAPYISPPPPFVMPSPPFPQGFPSPQRSPMIPPYQYQGVMVRYPEPPVMIQQRPVMMEMQYNNNNQETEPNESTSSPHN